MKGPSPNIDVRGLDELLATLKSMYDDEEGRDIEHDVLQDLLAVARKHTPVRTGSMRAAWDVSSGRLGISDGARNTRTRQAVADYAGEVDRRVGIVDAVVNAFPDALQGVARAHGYK